MLSFLVDFIHEHGLMPQISETERIALDAGTVWVEREFFSGNPNLKGMLSEEYPTLSPAEQDFLDGPVQQVCEMVDDWKVINSKELPEEVWEFLRAKGFFGLSIPRTYGGIELSNLACSTVFMRLATRSLTLSAVVLLPNSIGPGKLMLEYGTDEQKNYYLPRLARGEEIPCFALTEPGAGSDAASLTSKGEVFEKDGEPYIRLSWQKRYITMAPIATLLGLAFKLEDPAELLGQGTHPGITVALVPTNLPGVEIGRRHDAMGVPFPNGPTDGRNVELPASQIIGGGSYAGKGWKMLMEALSGGRGISLPAQSVAGAQAMTRIVGAYSAVRKQFGISIGRFEGVQEPLARIAGISYLMEAARVHTCGAIDRGQKPPVVSAMVKYQQTELCRRLVTDGMDVMGGAALCRGPRNMLAVAYSGAPISITVEGANILTRCLIVFGQGAIRCHPYAQREIEALEKRDGVGFGRALMGHVIFLIGNVVRACARDLTRGRLIKTPVSDRSARHYQRLSWASTRFALLADLAMFGVGSKLKRKQMLTGRLADALSWMFLAFCSLRRFEAEGRLEEDRPLLDWSVQHALTRTQEAMEGFLANVSVPVLGPVFRFLVHFWVRINPVCSAPADSLTSRIATIIQKPGLQRNRLTAGVFLSKGENLETDPQARLENAFHACHEVDPILKRLKRAQSKGELSRGPIEDRLDTAMESRIITGDEARTVRATEALRRAVLEVDSFTEVEYFPSPPHAMGSPPRTASRPLNPAEGL